MAGLQKEIKEVEADDAILDGFQTDTYNAIKTKRK